MDREGCFYDERGSRLWTHMRVGLEMVAWWADPDGLFALSLARRAG